MNHLVSLRNIERADAILNAKKLCSSCGKKVVFGVIQPPSTADDLMKVQIFWEPNHAAPGQIHSTVYRCERL